jgi:hypothetical protein
MKYKNIFFLISCGFLLMQCNSIPEPTPPPKAAIPTKTYYDEAVKYSGINSHVFTLADDSSNTGYISVDSFGEVYYLKLTTDYEKTVKVKQYLFNIKTLRGK